MPQTSGGGKRAAVSSSGSGEGHDDGGVDRISALPDGVLHHVLGFLPAHEAVRTSALAPRWRHLWRRARRLRINNLGGEGGWDAPNGDMRGFVNALLLLRDHDSTLDEASFQLGHASDHQMDIWIRHVLPLQTRELVVYIPREVQRHCRLGGPPPLASRHLTRLELGSVDLHGSILEFASCPALEILEMRRCGIYSGRISSRSLKHLRIVESSFVSETRARISVPAVTWLQLDNFEGKAPLLEAMPSLQTAIVKPVFCDQRVHSEAWFVVCAGGCVVCRGDDDGNACCRLLGDLSNASNLGLTAHPTLIIFRRDNLRWCPTFSKLKKLLLDESCEPIDVHALALILGHSPILENLTLRLCTPLGVEGNFSPMEKIDGISEHLKVAKVNCEVVDERVQNILKFLSTLGIKVTLEVKRQRYSSLWESALLTRAGVGNWNYALAQSYLLPDPRMQG